MGRLCGRLTKSSRWGFHCSDTPSQNVAIHVSAHSPNRRHDHQPCLHAQVGNKDVLNCYYAHAEDSLQVRPLLQLHILHTPDLL